MKCLIIAAGRGSRLSMRGDSKPLISFLGLSLIERVILTAREAGLTDFYVVTGYNGEKVRHFLDALAHKRNIKITHIINNEWQKDNGISVLKAKEFLSEKFVLLMGDHVIDGSILRRLKDEPLSEGEVILAVDYNVRDNGLVDVGDATKVLVKDGKVADIGKDLSEYNAFDTGIFFCSPVIFSAIEQSARNGDSSLSGGIKVLAAKGKVSAFDIKDAFWIDVDDEERVEKAEKRLLASLKKTSDGPVSRYLNRPLSLWITKKLLNTRITPNMISLFSFVLSMLGTLFFFLGGYPNLVTGAVLAQVSSVIDGCDGEVARLKFLSTDFGGWFDAVLDRYADAFLLLGLTYYVYIESGSILSFFIGFLAIIGSFMNSYTADKYDGLMKRRLGSGRHYFRIGRDVRVFILFVGALLNQPLLVLVVIALLMNTENIRRIIVLYKDARH
jgi:CDP-L-myo-inositol myo-inositolphosphotransferase